ncbi:MAG TPA: META domain-containing protein [Acidobacteriota bacterium]|nr:META domain-containing protein [Acidobacteriota bacterium]
MNFTGNPGRRPLAALWLLGLMLPLWGCSQEGAGLALVGPEWRLVEYGGLDHPAQVLEGTEAQVQFGPDGRMVGNAGCNDIQASYQLQGDRLEIGEIASTRKFCHDPEDIMDQEAQIIRALMSAESASIEDNRLRIFYDQSRRALFFRQAAP